MIKSYIFCFYIITQQIYTLMGHQISTESQLGTGNRHSIQEKYHTNLFIKNRKSNRQFQKEIHSVCKRSSYLHYDWAELLLRELKTGDPNRLYSEYQTTLKENCIRAGKREKIFCPAKIQRQFIESFGQRAKEEKNVTVDGLESAFEQSKCYFMVMSWLHKMVTLSSQDQQNIVRHLNEEWDLTEEEQIYEILLNLAKCTFNKIKGSDTKTEYQNGPEQLTLPITKLIKRLTTQKLRFIEKEAIVAQIQAELQTDLSIIEPTLHKLKSILGHDTIYGYLRTMREVGHFDVSFLWKHFGEELS